MSPAAAAQLHLALNHLPVLGLPFAAALLASGLRRRSDELVRAGLVALVLAGASAALVYWSGLRVGDAALDWPGVEPAAVDAHFRAARLAAAACVAVGLGAYAALARPSRRAALVVLLASLPACALTARAAHLGGLIRHVELR